MPRIRPWEWVKRSETHWQLIDGNRDTRADVWINRTEVVWHTYNERGVGGENSSVEIRTRPTGLRDAFNQARDEAVAAVVRQGWAPGGWKVKW